MATTTKLIVGCPYLAMDQSTRAFEFNPIAIVRSCFKEKFAAQAKRISTQRSGGDRSIAPL